MRILIFRHAEKPEERGNPHLSALGWRRAAALARQAGEWAGSADALFAAASREDSNRPVETVSLLAAALRLPIQCDLREAETDALAARLRAPDAPWRDGTALVCWRHRFIPALAMALGARDAPAEWPETEYDRVWCLTLAASGMALDATRRLPRG